MKSSGFRIILNNPELVQNFPSSLHLLATLLIRMCSISHSARDTWKINCCYSIVRDFFSSKFNYGGASCQCWISFPVLHRLYHLHESEVHQS